MRKNTDWEPKRAEIETIIRGYFGVNFLQKTRKRKVCLPRQIYMHCLRKFTEMRLDHIGKVSGFKDHSTPSHSIQVVRNLVKYDDKIKAQLTEIESMIK